MSMPEVSGCTSGWAALWGRARLGPTCLCVPDYALPADGARAAVHARGAAKVQEDPEEALRGALINLEGAHEQMSLYHHPPLPRAGT